MYLWVKNYKCIKDQEFNFSSEVEFHFDMKNLSLSQISKEEAFSGNRFFSRKDRLKNIDNISVITGENGSGKSTIASILFNFLVDSQPDESLLITKEDGEYILYNYHVPIELTDQERIRMGNEREFNEFYQQDGDFYIRFNHEPLRSIFIEAYRGLSPEDIRQKLTINAGDIKQAQYGPYNKFQNTHFIYYSPQFTNVYNLPHPDWSHDISTTCLIEEDVRFFDNLKSMDYKTNPTDKITAHTLRDYHRLANFLARADKKFVERIRSYFPRGFNISIDFERINRITEESENTSIDPLIKKVEELLSKKIPPFSTYSKKHQFICGLVRAYLVSIIRSLSNNIRNPLADLLSEFISGLPASLLGKPIEIWYGIYGFIRGERIIYEKFDFFDKLLKIIDVLPDTSFVGESPNIYIRFSKLYESANLDNFLEVISLYGDSIILDPYFNLYMYPKISSGEYSLLIVFSRLYDLLTQEKESNYLLFFDEIEVTLHPELQRTIIDLLIEFFNLHFSEKQFQLIFATHSPMLLSDVPTGNAIFLNKDSNGKTQAESIPANTFGANIHSLYRNNFYLKDGVMGKFAESLINGIIEKINSEQDLSNNDLFIISQIGEPILKQSIEQILNSNKITNLEKENSRLKAKLGEK